MRDWLLHSQALAGLMVFSSALGNCFGTGTLWPTLAKQFGELVPPCTSRHQWLLSAAFGNLIDICHPITSRLAWQHLDRTPCASMNIRTWTRDLRWGWPGLEGAAWTARPGELGNVVCPTLQSCCRHHAAGSPCSFAEGREDCFQEARPKPVPIDAMRRSGIDFGHRKMSQTIVQDTHGYPTHCCLARNIRLSIRWIASETNPSYESSRFFFIRSSLLLSGATERCVCQIPQFRLFFQKKKVMTTEIRVYVTPSLLLPESNRVATFASEPGRGVTSKAPGKACLANVFRRSPSGELELCHL